MTARSVIVTILSPRSAETPALYHWVGADADRPA